MTDPCALSDALLRRERLKWRDRAAGLSRRLEGRCGKPLAPWEYCGLKEALSFAEAELGAVEGEIERRERG